MKTFLIFTSVTAMLAAVAAERPSHSQQAAPAAAPGKISSMTAPQASPPPFTSIAAMQAEFVRRFEASPGFGLSRVARPVFLAPIPSLVCNEATYTVVPPELMALEDEPVVYAAREHGFFGRTISTNETRREIRKLFKPRCLTAQETNVVIALRQGRELVVLTNTSANADVSCKLFPAPTMQVYGALRSGKSCVACHQCEPGTLLGAFVYTLTPAPAAANPPSTPSPSRKNIVARLAVRFPLPLGGED